MVTADSTPTRKVGARRMLRSALATAVFVASGAMALAATPSPAVATGAVTSVELPGTIWPLDVATVPGKAIWVARGTTVNRFSPGSAPQTFTLPAGSNARHLAVGPDGTLWFGGMDGSLGTIADDGTVTTRALADPTTGVNALAVGNDGALWVLASGASYVNHLERGAPGGPMTTVTIPAGAHYDAIAAGGSGAVVAVGSDAAWFTAAGTATSLVGVPGGTITDMAHIGTETWVTTSSGMAVIDASNQVTAYAAADIPGAHVASITAGPDARAWYAAGGFGGVADQADLLGRIGATGPEATTLLTVDGTSPVPAEAWHLVADPSAERLWAVAYDSGSVVLRPIDVSRRLSSMTVDDPGEGLAFGVPVTVTARFTAFPGGTLPTSGTVTFYDRGTALGTTGLTAGGIATTSVLPPADSLMLSATYSGNAQSAPAISPIVTFRTVADAPTATTITPPTGKIRPGTATFKVKVTSTTAGVLPTGTVTFGGLELPVSGGTDTSFTVAVSPGANSFTATFVPDPGLSASSASVNNVIARWDTDEENYVMAAYLRLFNRYPDPAGRTYWANKIHNGLSRDRFALTQVATSEYRRTLAKRVGLVAPAATVAQAKPIVDAMATKTVRDLLVDKWADAKSITSCVDGVAPTVTPGTYMCWAKMLSYTYKGTATFEDYQWVSSYGNTPEGRRKVAKILIYSDTAVRPLVERAYSAYLGRSPDSGGWAYWTKKIQAGMREEGVEARVLGSDEFFRRSLLPAV